MISNNGEPAFESRTLAHNGELSLTMGTINGEHWLALFAVEQCDAYPLPEVRRRYYSKHWFARMLNNGMSAIQSMVDKQ